MSWIRSVNSWFESQATGKLALVAAIIVSMLVWGAFLFGPTDPNPPIGENVGGTIPDLVATVDVASSVDDEWLASARSDLEAVRGVTSSSVDWLSGGLTAFYLGVDEPTVNRRSLESVIGDIEATLARSAGAGAESVDVSGRLVVEHDVRSSYRTTVVVLAALAAAIGLAVMVAIDRWVGLLVTASAVGSTFLAPLVARQPVGSFDGTLASTDVVSAFAAFITAVLMCWRLIVWFAAPSGADGAEMIRRSVADCCADLGAVMLGLVAVGSVLAAFSSITNPLWSILVGLVVACGLSVAVVAPGLAAAWIGERASGWPEKILTIRSSLLGLRALPSTPATVLGCLAVLVLLSIFSIGEPSRRLMGSADRPSGDDRLAVDELFSQGAGNPTEALVVVLGESSESTIGAVASTVVPLSSVAWVDTATTRYIGADQTDAIDGVGLLTASVLGAPGGVPPADLDRVAVVVPAIDLVSPEGAELIENVRSLDEVTVQSEALADLTTRGSGRLVILVALLVALMSAVTARLFTSDRTYGVTVGGLVLVFGLAVAGLYRLGSGPVTVAELVTVNVLASALFLLWALAFSRRARQFDDDSSRSVDGDDVVVAMTVAIVGSVVMSVGALFANSPGVARLGLGLALVLAVVALTGMGLLGPALLGQRAVFHRLVRPLRSALHPDRPPSSVSASVADSATYSKWTKVASDLVAADFRLQRRPGVANENEVALPDTPVYEEVQLRQARLRTAGLRVQGREPVVRRVDVVRHGQCPAVSLTVDHPERKLVAADGAVVGVRRPERQSLIMWLASVGGGRFVMAEVIETGTYPLEYIDLLDRQPEPSVIDLTDEANMPAVGDRAL